MDMKGEIRIEVVMDDDDSTYICRICHQEEEEGNEFESPCACSGTLKFAHRVCVQRWCNEKGNTICEICLQEFEAGYSSQPPPSKKQFIDTTLTVLSLEDPTTVAEDEEEDDRSGSCVAAADRSVACCRKVAVIFTALLLIRHIIALLTEGVPGTCPFSLLTLLLVKISGILFPMYILLRILSALHQTITRQSS